ncbi:MAG: single-stranded DNA-binding protein [Candidatus Dormiibacterota bacterium]
MAGSLNKVMLIGRLTRDPEMRYTPSGQPVTSFGLATNRYSSGGDSGERREMTDFHDVVAWNIGRRNLAEVVAQFTKKGALVYVEGRLQTRSWDGQDGQKRYRTEVVATDVQFLDSRSDSDGGGYQRGGGQGTYQQPGEYAPQPGAPAPQGGSGAPPPASGGSARNEPAVQDVDPDDIPF